jgi:hypothetical protein
MSHRQLHVDTSLLPEDLPKPEKSSIIDHCRAKYHDALCEEELVIGRTSLEYVTEESGEKGPLLQYSNTASTRYLDLYDAYVNFEIENKIPMINSPAGHLKAEGLTTQEIISLEKPAGEINKILENLKKPFIEHAEHLLDNLKPNDNFPDAHRKEFCKMLHDTKSRKEYLDRFEKQKPTSETNLLLYETAKEYDETMKLYDNAVLKLFSPKPELEKFLKTLTPTEFADALQEASSTFAKTVPAHGDKELLTKVFQKLDRHGNSIEEIEKKFSEAARLSTKSDATADERLLMEIRYRLCDEENKSPTETGSLGQNPLAYLNIVTKGDPQNP